MYPIIWHLFTEIGSSKASQNRLDFKSTGKPPFHHVITHAFFDPVVEMEAK